MMLHRTPKKVFLLFLISVFLLSLFNATAYATSSNKENGYTVKGLKGLVYGGTILFLKKNETGYYCNGYYMPGPIVYVNLSNIQGNRVVVTVTISGQLDYYKKPSLLCEQYGGPILYSNGQTPTTTTSTNFNLTCTTYGNIFGKTTSCEGSGGGISENVSYIYQWQSQWRSLNKVVKKNYTLVLTYVVDTKVNYAWYNKTFLGFFPFYIFPPITYKNATNIKKFLYNDLKLGVASIGGQPLISHVYYGGNLSIIALTIGNKYINMGVVYHYPISITGIIPLNSSRYMYVNLGLGKLLLKDIATIDNYPNGTTTIDYRVLAGMIAVFASIAAFLAFYFARRKHRAR
ncbi:MAG: hypothetical protein G5Z42_01785 [Caldisphaeraceae archaeon]|nr:hypothetical protein [Caldisphaeraceae archaeon]MEB3691805.1 hypothetical protein [Caldisphaeraceae archaeon]MEB3797537.1 hypothetical protein [Caldisphaeraceae archaeon]